MNMQELSGKLLKALVEHFGDDTRRIEHAHKVLHHALCLLDETPDADKEVVIAAAVTHDFGITEAEAREGRSDGALQEKYGPDLVRPVLEKCGMQAEKIKHVLDIIAHHHSPPESPTLELQLLYESDWLVNVQDSPAILESPEKTRNFIARNFSTPAGKKRAEKILLKQEALFQKMGKVYKLLVGGGSRREKEEDFILEKVRQAREESDTADFRVLDLGCGTGFHSRILGEAGFHVLGLDYSEHLLQEARKQTPEDLPVTYKTADLREPFPVGEPGDFLLFLGNTLSIFENIETVEKVLRNARAAARPGAGLLAQIVNYEPLLQGKEARHLTSRGEVEGRETVLTKTLMPLPERRQVLIQLAASENIQGVEWESFARNTLLQPLAPADLSEAAAAAGWSETGRWGNLQCEAYDSTSSSDFVIQVVLK
ncbi:MAG: methyltransferase domain-containing protein [Candidatus Sumerlaeota bacterium]